MNEMDLDTREGRLSGEDGLMLKKKSEKLSRVFKEILSRPSISSHKKRKKHEDQEDKESVVSRTEKRKKKEMIKRRGHQVVPKLGEDSVHDRLEKRLIKTATKGVVQIFNTVSRANKEEKIRRKEAILKQKEQPADSPSDSEDQWGVLQDTYLDQQDQQDSEDLASMSESVDLDESISLDEDSE